MKNKAVIIVCTLLMSGCIPSLAMFNGCRMPERTPDQGDFSFSEIPPSTMLSSKEDIFCIAYDIMEKTHKGSPFFQECDRLLDYAGRLASRKHYLVMSAWLCEGRDPETGKDTPVEWTRQNLLHCIQEENDLKKMLRDVEKRIQQENEEQCNKQQ